MNFLTRVTLAATAFFVTLLTAVSLFAQTTPANRLRYAQVANGQLTSDSFYVTSLYVTNPNNFSVQAVIDTFDEATTNPMNLGFETNCQLVFDPATGTNDIFVIQPFATCSFISDGGFFGNPSPGLKVGWLRVTETTGANVIGGYLQYTFYQGTSFDNAFPIFVAGVSPTPVLSQFALPVTRDVGSNQDTGFAMANPFSDGPITMNAQLVDVNGNVIDQQTLTLGAFAHMRLFLSQLFPSITNASNFVGDMVVTALNSGDGAITAGLTEQGGDFGGAPPTSNVILSQKQATALARREANQPARTHEEITQVKTFRKF